MIEKDTIRLLRECDAGVKMGISSIDDVLEQVTDKKIPSAAERLQGVPRAAGGRDPGASEPF